MTDFEDSNTAHQTQALTLNGSHILSPDFAANPFASPPPDPLELTDLSLTELHDRVTSEVTTLDMLSREGQLRIRTRLLILFAEMGRRFNEGLSYDGLTGQRAMAAYLRSVGCDPGKLRVWRFLLRREEMSKLAGETVVPTDVGEVEVGDADDPAVANQDVTGEDLLSGDIAVSAPTLEGGESCDLPAADFNPAYFEAALSLVERWCLSTPAGAPVYCIFARLKDPRHVLSHALKLRKVAFSLQTVAEQANQLSEAMSTALKTASEV